MTEKKIYTVSIKTNIYKSINVDVIVPFYNRLDLLIQFFREFTATAMGINYKFMFVDDGSTDTNIYRDLNKSKVRVIRHEDSKGFGYSLNEGFINTNSDYILCINNDCLFPKRRWFHNLIDSYFKIKKEIDILMISPKISEDDKEENFIYNNKINIETSDLILNKGESIPLVCFFAKRQDFNKIGGFIRSYPLVSYEDEELHYRCYTHNKKQAICGKSLIKHLGSQTLKMKLKQNPSLISVIENNRKRCINDIKALNK